MNEHGGAILFINVYHILEPFFALQDRAILVDAGTKKVE